MVSSKAKSYMFLSLLPEVGAITGLRLVDFFGSPEEVLKASKSALMQVDRIGDKIAQGIVDARDAVDIEKICQNLEARGGSYICCEDAEYPAMLKNIPDKPLGLYSLGKLDFSKPAISIIGSRKCSIYGQSVARKFGEAFAASGFNVISGMARGIDSAAHQGALDCGGMTTAVFGCGVDIVYPPENIDIYKKILDKGLAISEFPLGMRADKQTFPIRNRIIAGLSLATIVVESDSKGGSMITARLAAEYGKEVFAVPGRIDQPSSKGCHDLIRDGATLITSVEDVLETLKFSGQLNFDFNTSCDKKSSEEGSANLADTLPADEKLAYKFLQNGEALNSADLAHLTGLKIGAVMASLTMLELKKLISRRPDGRYEKRF